MRIFGVAIVRADRLNEEYWQGFQLGRRSGRAAVVSMLKRLVELGDVVTARHILEDLARRDPVDLDDARTATHREGRSRC